MKIVKAAGLTAIAALAAMAFIGVGTASAAHEVALCRDLVNLCANNRVLPAGTELLALASNPELKAEGVSPVKCEDSVAQFKTTAEMGSPLPLQGTSLEFGKLPAPSLGSGCTTCTGGVHTKTPISANISVSGTEEAHVWTLEATGEAVLLNCFGLGIECGYGNTGIKSPIDADAGTHKNAVEEKGLATILVNTTLKKTSGGIFCPSTGTWTANYTVFTCHVPPSEPNIRCYLALREQL